MGGSRGGKGLHGGEHGSDHVGVAHLLGHLRLPLL